MYYTQYNHYYKLSHAVESMNKATNHLLSNLTEREKLEAERKAYQALEDQELDRKRIREKVLKFGQDAIKGDTSCDLCVVSTLINVARSIIQLYLLVWLITVH